MKKNKNKTTSVFLLRHRDFSWLISMLYGFSAVNGIYTFLFMDKSAPEILIQAVVLLMMVPVSIFDPRKENRSLLACTCTFLVLVGESLLCFLESGNKTLIVITIGETLICIVSVLLLLHLFITGKRSTE